MDSIYGECIDGVMKLFFRVSNGAIGTIRSLFSMVGCFVASTATVSASSSSVQTRFKLTSFVLHEIIEA